MSGIVARMPALRNGVIAAHIVLTSIMAWWCFDLLRPVDTFGSSRSYSWFGAHWPYDEDMWGAAFGIAALIGIAGLSFKNRWVRLLCAVLLAGAHGDLAFATYISNGASTGTGTYGILAIFALWRIWAEGLV